MQRPLWASTGVKDPAYPDTLYVTDLVGSRHRQHDAGGDPRRGRRPRRRSPATRSPATTPTRPRCSTTWPRSASSYHDVVEMLESEGVEKFEKSLDRAADRRPVPTERRQAVSSDQARRRPSRSRSPFRDRAAYDDVVAGLVAGQGRQPAHGARTPRCGVRTPSPRPSTAGLGRRWPRPRDRWSPRSRRCASELRRRASTTSCCAGWAARRWRPRSSRAPPASSSPCWTPPTPTRSRPRWPTGSTRTVVVVSSKSGGTVETDSQRRAYEKAFTDAGIDAGRAHRRRDRPRLAARR